MDSEDTGLRGLAEFIADNAQPKSIILLTGEKAEGHRDVVAVPEGYRLHSVKPFLDEYLLTPERVKGTSTHTILDS